MKVLLTAILALTLIPFASFATEAKKHEDMHKDAQHKDEHHDRKGEHHHTHGHEHNEDATK